MQLLLAIPVVLYLGFAVISILLLVFIFFPIVLPLVAKISFLDFIRSSLRGLGRSPFYVSLVATGMSVGILALCGLLVGQKKIRTHFRNAVEQDSIMRVGGYLFVPYPKDMRYRENYYHGYYKHRGILIVPQTSHRWEGLYHHYWSAVTPLTRWISLLLIGFLALMMKDYFVLKRDPEAWLAIGNALADLILLWGSIFLGIQIGKEMVRRKISCAWARTSSGLSAKPTVVGDYLCSPAHSKDGDSYIMVYHVIDLDELSFADADQVYVKFKAMVADKMDLKLWS